MKKSKKILSIVIVAIALVLSGAVYCQNYIEEDLTKDLIEDAEKWRDRYPSYTAELEPFDIHLQQIEKHTVYIRIPVDVNVRDAYMRIETVRVETLANVTITLGNETRREFRLGESIELTDSINKYLETNRGKGEYTVLFPMVVESEQKVLLNVAKFYVEFKVNPPHGLRMSGDSLGTPQYFLWNPSPGLNPQYELQISSERYSSDKGMILAESPIRGTFYELSRDKLKLEPGKTYFWNLRVMYRSDKQREYKSSWSEPYEFTSSSSKPPSVTELVKFWDPGNKIRFAWTDPGNAEFFRLELNGYVVELNWDRTSYTIDLSTTDLGFQMPLLEGTNAFVVRAVSGNEMSDPTTKYFTHGKGRLPSPERDKLWPNCSETVEKPEFTFKWELISDARGYEVEIRDSDDIAKMLPTKEGLREKALIISSNTYDPWDKGNNGNLELTPGEIYRWKVRALPKEGSNLEASEWVEEMFLYQPVLMRVLALFSAIGGVMGGFIRIAQDERTKARDNKRRMRIYLDYQTSVDLIVGLIIGVMFYLMINQTLSQQLNPLNIPPYNYAGGVILGFIGGLISYDLTRLRRVLPE